VPGLPLTFLEYNLVSGDSLAGIGTLDEVSDMLDDEQKSLGDFVGGQDIMEDIREDIDEIGDFSDTSAEQVQEVRETRQEIENKLKQVEARFDILASSRVDEEINIEIASDTSVEEVTDSLEYKKAQEVLEYTNAIHFPTSFPEVFDGDNAGFDVVVGNPPWEESTLEEKEFWSRYVPGLQAKSQTQLEEIREEMRAERPDLVSQYQEELEKQQRRAQILKDGPYPGVGSGGSAPDTYLAFCWRFWRIIKSGGYTGVVLPRGAFSGDVSEEFRLELLEKGDIFDLTFLVNNKNWVFQDVHPQYTIGLLSFSKQENQRRKLPIRGPCTDEKSYADAMERPPHIFDADEAKDWTGNAALPILPPSPASIDVFDQIVTPHERVTYRGEWMAYPTTELNSGTEKSKDDGTKLMHFFDNKEEVPEEHWPVFKGKSFDIWTSDTGTRYAWADPEVMTDYLHEARKNSYKYAGKNSKFYEMTKEWVHSKDTLPCYKPRIAFRDVSRDTDSRTLRPALVRKKVFLTDTAPYFLWPEGGVKDEAYLLGILSSIPLDWYSRRFVAKHVTLQIARALPVPRPGEENTVRERTIQLSGRLAAVDERYADWADEVGVEYGPLDEDEKQEKIYELDAVVSHLYGLTREHVEVIFETFHDNWDHEERLESVLEYYDEWENELDLDHTEEEPEQEVSTDD
jgi:ElaB/YqjD/DUF883 family membrane-anchored ribosome-binding protein